MSEDSSPILMTQAEYARHRAKSPEYIGKPYQAGIVVTQVQPIEFALPGIELGAADAPKGASVSIQPAARPLGGLTVADSIALGTKTAHD